MLFHILFHVLFHVLFYVLFIVLRDVFVAFSGKLFFFSENKKESFKYYPLLLKESHRHRFSDIFLFECIR